MKHRGRLVAAAAAGFIVVAALASSPLIAQVQPGWPDANQKEFELTIPPGIYTAMFFTAEGQPAKAYIVDGSTECRLIVQSGQTLTLPLGAQWSLGRGATVRVESGRSTLAGWGMTPSGPIAFEQKK